MPSRIRHPKLPFGPLLVAAMLAASLLVAVLGLRSVGESRKAAVRLAEVQSQNLAQAIDQQITASISRIDQALIFVAGSMERELQAGRPDMTRMAKVVALAEKTLPEVAAIRVAGADGTVILNNPSRDPTSSVADRFYFTYLRDHPEAGIFVPKPSIGMFLKKWVIIPARRYNRPDGSFGGVVVAPVLVEHFQQALSGYDPGPSGLLTLRDEDGGFVARHTPVVKGQTLGIGERVISKELEAILASGVARQTYATITPFDRTDRLFTFRRLKGMPFIVLAGLAGEDYLRQWRRDRNRTLLLMGTFIVVAWGMAGLLVSLWRVHQRNLQVLQASEAKYRSLVETAQELVWKVDAEGRFTYLNPAWEQTHGYRVGEMLGRSFQAFQTPEVFRRDHAAFAELLRSGEGVREYETTHLARDGRELTLVFNAIPLLDGDGAIVGCQGTAVDVTDRRRAEEERERLRAQLHQSQKLESLGSLAGGVAHDMNNVLGAIMGLASIHAAGQPAGSPVQLAFETILKAADRGGKMVKSLLGFARHTPAELHRVDLNELLTEQVRLLERTTLSRVILSLDLEPRLHPIQGDAAALSHAVMNLCVNAVDAMPEGGTLRLRTRNLEGDGVELQVGDTGSGMSREVLDRALDPFFTTKAQGKGTGLGLSMVHAAVKAHGGEMELHSEPGQGTTVGLRFPAWAGADLAPEGGPEGEVGPAAADRRPLMVLLVDDDELVQRSLRALMETLGHGTAQALTGEEALVRLEDGLEPDVVILDMNMPGLGGKGTFTRLRSLHPTLPILLSTGKVDDAALQLVAGDAHAAVLSKPYTLEELRRRLGQLTERTA
ncbi:MAG TPA: ATP-binding protein [Holophagaceae bacterium]|nr:ATP-binding protein [Holophagaceae bacterium]